jgi:nucleotide-binding universal stress UspA family protein
MVPFHTILVPLDGSPLAERALAPALRIAEAMAGRAGGPAVRLILLRVVGPVALVAADPMLYDELMRMGVDEAQAYLNTIAQTLSPGAVTVETRAINGSAADAIVFFAEGNGVDLIVMSSHGRTGSSRWVYGSVAEKVLHHAPCATIIIRAHVAVEMFQNRKILVPLDGSPLAEQALEPALTIAEAVGSDVTLVRVAPGREPLPQSMTPSGEDVGAALDQAAAREREEAEAYLQHIYTARPNQHLFIDVVTTEGDVADAIVSYAETHHSDLIVMSSHGRSGIGRWLHGSVAEKVLRGADCATLIIRSPRAQSQ